jgi:drug/metabolite transporter (DMT)-like permease
MIKGLGYGFGALIIALIVSDYQWNMLYALLCMLLGFSSYGLSIYFYIKAQRVSVHLLPVPIMQLPRSSSLLSLLLLHETINWALLVGIAGNVWRNLYRSIGPYSHVHTHQPITLKHRHHT